MGSKEKLRKRVSVRCAAALCARVIQRGPVPLSAVNSRPGSNHVTGNNLAEKMGRCFCVSNAESGEETRYSRECASHACSVNIFCRIYSALIKLGIHMNII